MPAVVSSPAVHQLMQVVVLSLGQDAGRDGVECGSHRQSDCSLQKQGCCTPCSSRPAQGAAVGACVTCVTGWILILGVYRGGWSGLGAAVCATQARAQCLVPLVCQQR